MSATTVFETDDAPVALTLNDFQHLASRTLPSIGYNHSFCPRLLVAPRNAAEQEVEARFHRDIDLTHAAFGLAGEIGELIDPVKKAMFYGKPLDVENIKEEAGDLLWYIAGPLCRALGCTLQDLAAANVAKLRKRYPEKYTDGAAVARVDKAPEAAEVVSETVVMPCGFKTGKASGILRTNISPEEKATLRAKYGDLIDYADGYYWDVEGPCWRPVPELFAPVAPVPALGADATSV